MHKKTRLFFFIFILCQIIAISNNACTGSKETSKDPYIIKKIGNPGATQFPNKDSLDRQARQIYDLCLYEGRIYVGTGDMINNRGPIKVWSFDNALDPVVFADEFTVDEEQVEIFRTYDSTLFIPGMDARESWDFGNYYFKANSTWTKRRTIPYAVHVKDIAKYNNKLCVLDMGGALAMGGANGSRLMVSDDNGLTWSMITNQFIGEQYYTAFYNLLPFKEFLIFCGIVQDGPDFEHYYGSFVFRYSEADNMLTNLTIPFTPKYKYQNVLLGYGTDESSEGLAILADLDGKVNVIDQLKNRDCVDVVARDNRCYALTLDKPTDSTSRYTAKIYSSGDLTNWTELAQFTLSARPHCLEMLDGYFFIGCDSNYDAANKAYIDDDSGSIWKIRVN